MWTLVAAPLVVLTLRGARLKATRAGATTRVLMGAAAALLSTRHVAMAREAAVPRRRAGAGTRS